MAWGHRTVYVQQPAKSPETPQDQYLRILEAAPFSERAGAIGYFLGEHEDKAQAMQCAQRLAADPEAALRFAGAAALVRLHLGGSREAEKTLWTLIRDESPKVRAKVADGLKWDNLPETGRLKQALAEDADPTVRAHAAMGLYLLGDEASRASLLALTWDPVAEVRAEAIYALQNIEEQNNPPPPTEFLGFVEDPSPLVRSSLAAWLHWENPAISFPYLHRLVRDPDASVRFQALASLGANPASEVTTIVRSATADPDPSIRAEALSLLQSRACADLRQVLLANAADSSSVVRKQVAYGLERDPTPDLLPTLEKFSEDEANMNIRRSALRSLEQLPGVEAEALIVRMLRDPAKPIAKAAEKVLKQRAKIQGVSLESANIVQFGLQDAVATRLAFHGLSKVPLKAWEDFLSQIIRLDGRPKADSASSPAVQVEAQDGTLHCILPFGPAQWIRLDTVFQPGHPTLMGFAIQTTKEVAIWFQTQQPRHFNHGLRLAKRLGWVEGSSPTSDNPVQTARAIHCRARPSRGALLS
ncbi:HEAT repeat domain-containing protein [Mesoterricola silvestris]|uniref:HEAT repeat domain-containing protein n=1 Tax=Mesoterricola silvestris TaxID=2927979 RepID=A0AA48K797_9BACT|nr:HEAT repeat domain-containing protein [Mesoterricola silvestris]BDU70851.1 hypothetical protein METEAL_00250 [Mesoterricola silvestris]